MDIKAYVEGVLATESKIEKFTGQPWQLDVVFSAFTRAGQKLDEIKRRVFYARTILPADMVFKVDPRVVHGILGVATEAGEMIENLSKAILRQDEDAIDKVNIVEECGDLLWYITMLADAVGCSLEEVMELNNVKLRKKRYKSGGFTAEEALNRDLPAERAALEQGKE